MDTASLPAWGVWIEMAYMLSTAPVTPSLPAWGVWIEIVTSSSPFVWLESLPAWGVWIEISIEITLTIHMLRVAPRMGSVD